jgi:ribonuclease HI
MTDKIIAYTDGSCLGNPGPGGWGYITILPDCEIWSNGQSIETTNNIMEITAVLKVLEDFSFVKYITIYTDSQYVINCATGKWQKKKNLELWQTYDKLSLGKSIIFKWVKGHNGDVYNELVDKLAKNKI